MTPNQITALRIAAGFFAVGLFQLATHAPTARLYANTVALVLILAAISLDALDGWVARRRNLATPLGAQLDILGDRVLENLFFTFFAVTGLVSLWIPVLFFVRGSATDFLRSLAARSGRAGFGPDGMLTSPVARALVASRFSRAAYGTVKCICFCALGLQLTLSASADPSVLTLLLMRANQFLVFATVAFCILRGVPVFLDGWRYLSVLSPTPASAGAKT